MLGCRRVMGDYSVPSKSNISKTHVYRDHLVCQICCKSAEKRYLKRDKFEKIANFEKFQEYSNKRDKKDRNDNVVKNFVKWNEINNETVLWALKQCKSNYFKDNCLEKQNDVK